MELVPGGGASISGRLPWVRERILLDTRLTSMFGLGTLPDACLMSSVFKGLSSSRNLGRADPIGLGFPIASLCLPFPVFSLE